MSPSSAAICRAPLLEERQATIQHYQEVVDLAADLGAKLVLYVGGWQIFGTTRRDAWAWSVEALREIAAHAKELDITIVAEPTSADSNLIESADDALELIRASEQSNVGVMFDTYHALYRNEVSADYVRTMGEHLVHVHASDTDRLPPGEGAVDWPNFMQALKEVDYQGFVTMEVGFNTRAAEPDRYARQALAFFKNLEQTLT